MSDNTSENREIEAKFNIDATARQLLLVVDDIADFHVAGRKAKQQDDIYFDTEQGDLTKAGATLRVRRLADGALMTYKGESQPSAEADESHFASRVEDESPLPQAFAGFVSLERPLPDGANISPLARARRLAPDGPFVPIARIENQRTVIDLANDAEVHVELAVDHCRGTRLRDGRVVEFDEVELESKNADRETLGRVARELQQRISGLRPSQETKLGRVMR